MVGTSLVDIESVVRCIVVRVAKTTTLEAVNITILQAAVVAGIVVAEWLATRFKFVLSTTVLVLAMTSSTIIIIRTIV